MQLLHFGLSRCMPFANLVVAACLTRSRSGRWRWPSARDSAALAAPAGAGRWGALCGPAGCCWCAPLGPCRWRQWQVGRRISWFGAACSSSLGPPLLAGLLQASAGAAGAWLAGLPCVAPLAAGADRLLAGASWGGDLLLARHGVAAPESASAMASAAQRRQVGTARLSARWICRCSIQWPSDEPRLLAAQSPWVLAAAKASAPRRVSVWRARPGAHALSADSTPTF